MYNKLFTKILDSSIWLEPTPTRIVWVTLIAAMDQAGFCAFAAIGNVANRARVTVGEATIALECLESPDAESGDKDHDGRRVERVPGGWLVLNADKYRALITTAVQRDQTRERVRRHRARNAVTAVTESLPVTLGNRSEALALAEAHTEVEKIKINTITAPTKPARPARVRSLPSGAFVEFWALYPRKVGKGAAWRAWEAQKPTLGDIRTALAWQVEQPAWTKDGGQFIPHPATWLNRRGWEDEPFNAPARTASSQPYRPGADSPNGHMDFSWTTECRSLHGEIDGRPRCGSRYEHAEMMGTVKRV